MYRRDSDGILVPMPSSGSGGTLTPPITANPPLKSKRVNNTPSNYQNIPEYFDGYFPQMKPATGEYYGKYELEISPQSQRVCSNQLVQGNANMPHHHQQPHQNHANYYNNAHSHLEANCNNAYQTGQPFPVAAGVTGSYPTQQTEYDLGAQHVVNPHQQQHQTYNSNYPNYPNQEYELGNGGSQNYGYQNFQNDKMEMAPYENGEYANNYPNYQNYPSYPGDEPTRPNPNFNNFNNVPQQHHQQQPFPQQQPHNHHPIQQPHNSLVENPNNSTDFNFLSNIANDFVPEYYQLS